MQITMGYSDRYDVSALVRNRNRRASLDGFIAKTFNDVILYFFIRT